MPTRRAGGQALLCPLCLVSPDPGRPGLAVPQAAVLSPPLVRPAHDFGSVCSLRKRPCRPGSPRLLVPVAFGTCHRVDGPEPLGQPRGQAWTAGRARPGAATRRPPGPASLSQRWPLGRHGPRAPRRAQPRSLGGGEGWPHGFLMAQIEVSLPPLRVGRNHQAGGGSARWPLPPGSPGPGRVPRHMGQHPPLQGPGLQGVQARVRTAAREGGRTGVAGPAPRPTGPV